MNRLCPVLRAWLPGLCFAAAACTAQAGDIKVLSAGAAKAAVIPLGEEFARLSGHNVTIDFGTMGLITEKLAKGEQADLLVVSSEVADALEKNGAIVRGSRRAMAQVGVGVAVGLNAPTPDISTAAAFRKTLLDARSIVMIDPVRGTSGKHLAEVFRRLGVSDLIKAKTRYGQGGAIVEPVGRGEVELGLHQISEILPVKGVRLVGPLPPELQKWTTYTSALTPAGANSEAAREFAAYLSSFQSKAVYLSHGFAVTD